MLSKFRLRAGVSVLTCVLLAGCAQWTHFNDTRSDFDGRRISSFIDAKQRAVTAVKAPDPLGGDLGYVVQICAEPSPDALSALAASQSLSLTGTTDSGAFSNALAESAGSIGLRTQSIQLMRDSMYRLCEAALSGYVNPLAYESMFRRYQNSMVAVLAIEQLTGAVRAPPIILTASGNACGAEEALQLAKMLDEQTVKLDQAKTALTAATENSNKAATERDTKIAAMKTKHGEDYLTKMSKEEKADVDKAITTATDLSGKKEAAAATVTRWEQVVAFTQRQQASVLGGGVTASTDGRIGQVALVDPATAIAVAGVVQSIVKDATSPENEAVDLCNAFWGAIATGRASLYIKGAKEMVLNPLALSCSKFAPEGFEATVKALPQTAALPAK